MTARNPPRCALCFGVVAPRDYALDICHPSGAPRVVIRWHSEGCIDDPVQEPFADAVADDDDANPEAVERAYLALLDALLARHGAGAFRHVVDVRVDVRDPRMTLRGPGASWGRLSPRRARPPMPVRRR